MKKLLIRCAIIFGVGHFGALLVASIRDAFSMKGADLFANLSDAFTIPGAILLSVGGLVWVAGDGFFDMISYGLKNGLHSLFPFYKMEKRTFYDYKVEKMQKREKGAFIPFLIAGAMMLLCSGIFFIIYLAV